MDGAAAPDDRMKRLIFVSAVSRVAYLKEAIELQESAHEHAETEKSFEQLVDYLASVEAKNRRSKRQAIAAAATAPAAKAKGKSAVAELNSSSLSSDVSSGSTSENRASP